MATVETPRTHVRAVARFVRTAPRKAQLVADQIRGRTVPEARTILAFLARDAARDVERVLASAVANAEANHGLSGDDLVVDTVTVGAGPALKRWRARARGRVGRIRKRTCHIEITLALPGGEAIPAPVKREVADAPASEPAVEQKPRRARKRPEDATAEPEEAVEAPPEEEAEEQAAEKPKRAPRKKAAPPAVAGEPEPPAAEKPKRAPRKRAEPDADEADGAEKPARRRKKES